MLKHFMVTQEKNLRKKDKKEKWNIFHMKYNQNYRLDTKTNLQQNDYK